VFGGGTVSFLKSVTSQAHIVYVDESERMTQRASLELKRFSSEIKCTNLALIHDLTPHPDVIIFPYLLQALDPVFFDAW